MYLHTRDLAVGYLGTVLIDGIRISVERGKILTLIGPNGSGKSTILKTISGHLNRISGVVEIAGKELNSFSDRELARQLSVLLTDRIKSEWMTCEDIVAMGRYPYTGHFGKLREEDHVKVRDSLKLVGAEELAGKLFLTVSDGQKQRILLARAICQQPSVLILDEPTSFLDIRHKIELLGILRMMAKSHRVAVIMSLHEIDLAGKISDDLICVKGDRIYMHGSPQEVLREEIVADLYDLTKGSYNSVFGSVELEKPIGSPEVFVLAGGGTGIPIFRRLQQDGIPFCTGILEEHDIDYQIAQVLASEVISCPPFSGCSEELLRSARKAIERCKHFIDSGVEKREHNSYVSQLREYATSLGKR